MYIFACSVKPIHESNKKHITVDRKRDRPVETAKLLDALFESNRSIEIISTRGQKIIYDVSSTLKERTIKFYDSINCYNNISSSIR